MKSLQSCLKPCGGGACGVTPQRDLNPSMPKWNLFKVVYKAVVEELVELLLKGTLPPKGSSEISSKLCKEARWKSSWSLIPKGLLQVRSLLNCVKRCSGWACGVLLRGTFISTSLSEISSKFLKTFIPIQQLIIEQYYLWWWIWPYVKVGMTFL